MLQLSIQLIRMFLDLLLVVVKIVQQRFGKVIASIICLSS
jgi:hypothetical protein